MTTEHPITPPSELFKQWEDDILNERENVDLVLDCAWKNGFRAGADHELDACCEVLRQKGAPTRSVLRSIRRPKPPSLKEQSLELIDLIQSSTKAWNIRDLDVIRRALEQLP